MAWLLLKIQANDQNAESISDALMELGALSASIEDAHAETVAEQAIFGEPGDPPPGIWQQNIVTAMLDESADVMQLLSELKTATEIAQFSYVTESIEEQDWVRATQAQFDPIHITDNLWIVPTWHTSPNKDAINIILDPGLAFGTGSHPTTHLCLEWLTQQSNLNAVLDYGCGSGILAIAAEKLGARNVVGVDIDDRDPVEGSYFINVTPNKGFFSKLLATASITKTYQLILKEDTNSQTKVIFVDLSEDDDQKTISYSKELFNQIASKF